MTSLRRTVLVVDDDPGARAATSAVVQRRGYDVVTASNGVEALAALDLPGTIDLVLLDMAMPELDGIETLQRIRAGVHDDVPVILLTPRKSDADAMKGYTGGADYYVPKGSRPLSLLRVIDYLIGDLAPAERARLETVV
jgi:DNA-binding response OmpR family regulator